jgi:hypothetical protein
MVTKTESCNLTKEEYEGLIENECRSRLGVTLKEFLLKRSNGGLPDKPLAIHDINLMLKLVRK